MRWFFLLEGACATPFAHGVGWGDALCRGVKGVNGENARWGHVNWGQIPIVLQRAALL